MIDKGEIPNKGLEKAQLAQIDEPPPPTKTQLTNVETDCSIRLLTFEFEKPSRIIPGPRSINY